VPQLPGSESTQAATGVRNSFDNQAGRRLHQIAPFSFDASLPAKSFASCFRVCLDAGILTIGMFLPVDRFERCQTFNPQDASDLEFPVNLRHHFLSRMAQPLSITTAEGE